jgi:APA family basic amino acid/polyamine antiporter
MATMIPASGSAYTYTYVVLGELLAWFVGWSLILEYTLVVSAVAVGWSGYARPCSNIISLSRTRSPKARSSAERFNLPAIFIIAVSPA